MKQAKNEIILINQFNIWKRINLICIIEDAIDELNNAIESF